MLTCTIILFKKHVLHSNKPAYQSHVSFPFCFKVSLILEYCAFGNLKAYLDDYEESFRQNLEWKDSEGSSPSHFDNDDYKNKKHNVKLMLFWSYQVIYSYAIGWEKKHVMFI